MRPEQRDLEAALVGDSYWLATSMVRFDAILVAWWIASELDAEVPRRVVAFDVHAAQLQVRRRLALVVVDPLLARRQFVAIKLESLGRASNAASWIRLEPDKDKVVEMEEG